MGMRGIRTASPSEGLVKIAASIMFSIVFFYGKSRAIAKLRWVDFLKVLLVCLFLVVARVVETLKDLWNLKIQMDN